MSKKKKTDAELAFETGRAVAEAAAVYGVSPEELLEIFKSVQEKLLMMVSKDWTEEFLAREKERRSKQTKT